MQERPDRIVTHIGRDGHGVGQIFGEKRPGVHLRRIPYVAPLRVGDNQHIGIALADIFDRPAEALPALRAALLVKGHVRLIADGIGSRRVDDRPVESENGIVLRKQVARNLVHIGIEPHTEKAAFGADLRKKLFGCHIYRINMMHFTHSFLVPFS